MKRIMAILVSLCVLLSGCDMVQGETSTGTLHLEATFEKTRGIESVDMETSYYMVSIFNEDKNWQSELKVSGSSMDAKIDVPTGRTSVSVTAYNSSDQAIGSGAESVVVMPNVVTDVFITVKENAGSGNLQVKIKAAEDYGVKVLVFASDADVDKDEPLHEVKLTYDGTSYVGTLPLKSGFYHLLVTDSLGNKINAPSAFRITGGLDTVYTAEVDDTGHLNVQIANAITKTPVMVISGVASRYSAGAGFRAEASVSGIENPEFRWWFDGTRLEGNGSVIEGTVPADESLNPGVPHSITCEAFAGDKVWTAKAEFTVRRNNEGEDALSGVTLQMWHAMSKENGAALQDVVDLFNSTNPYGITVEATYQGGYGDVHKKLLGALSAGNYPNIGQAYNNNITQYIPSGVLLDLTDYFHDGLGISEEDIATIEPSYLSENMSFPDHGMYAVSLGKSTEAFFYNKTFFKEHNLKVPATLDELTETASAASAITGTPSFGIDSTDNWGFIGPMNMGAEYAVVDGKVLLYDENNIGKTRAFYEWWENGVDNGWFRTPGEDRYCSGPYSAGSLIMYVGSSTNGNYIRPDGFEFGVARIPVGQEPHVIQQGGNYCGFKTGDPAIDLATSIFLEFLYTPEAGALFAANTGYLPSNNAGLQEQVFLDAVAAGGINGETKAVCASYPSSWKSFNTVIPEAYDLIKALSHPLKGIEVTDLTIDELIAEAEAKIRTIFEAK